MNISARLYVLVLFAGVLSASSVAQNASTPTKPKSPASTTKAVPAKTGAVTQQKKATTAKAKPALATAKDKASYALGYNLGRNLHGQLVDVDPAVVSEGFKDAFSDSKPLMTEEEIRAALAQLQQDVRGKQMAMMKELTDKNEKEGEAFLTANKTKEGVVTLPSGLEYKILKAGTGPKPTANDTVECNYRGTLLDGKEFDSSYKRGQAASFPVSGVIKGWTEALQLMPVGSKWELYVPAKLAYGDRGAGGEIPPGATLIFDVELLSIKPKEAEKPAETPKPEATKPADATNPAATTKPAESSKPADASKPTAEPAKPDESPQPKH